MPSNNRGREKKEHLKWEMVALIKLAAECCNMQTKSKKQPFPSASHARGMNKRTACFFFLNLHPTHHFKGIPHHKYLYYLFNYIVSYFISRVTQLILSITIITIPSASCPSYNLKQWGGNTFQSMCPCKEILLLLINTRQLLSQACDTAVHAIIEDNLTWQSPSKWHQIRIFKLRQVL
jgi:hypothetical protein